MMSRMILFRLILLIFFSMGLSFPAWSLSEEARQKLLHLHASITAAEKQSDRVAEELEKLLHEQANLKQTIKRFEYETARQWHAIARMRYAQSPLALLSADQTSQDHYIRQRTHESTQAILNQRLVAYTQLLTDLKVQSSQIEEYQHQRKIINISISNLKQDIEKNENIIKKLDSIIDQNSALDAFMITLLDLKITPALDVITPLSFTPPLSGVMRAHNTILTINSHMNSIVTAPERALVAYAGTFGKLGNIVILNHGQGYFSILRGLTSLSLTKNDLIKKGDIIGRIGGDGQKKDRNNAMLYYQLRYNNQIIDPIPKLTGLYTP